MRLMDNQQLNKKGMTKHIGYWLLAITVLLGVLVYLMSTSMSTPKSLIPPLTLPIDQLWSIEQAEKAFEHAYVMGSSSIANEEIMIKLIKQAWQGDKNALLQAIKIRSDADDYMDMMGKRSDVDIFIDENRHLLVNDSGEPLIEPEALKEPPFYALFLDFADSPTYKLVDELVELGHPEASYQAARKLMSKGYYQTLTPQEEQQIQYYLENALAGGYRVKHNMANLILFSGADYTFEPKENNPWGVSYLIPLTQRRPNIDPIQVKVAINYHHEYAIHGWDESMMRMAEAYYSGIGVEPNPLLANAWARATNYYLYTYIQKYQVDGDKQFVLRYQSMQKVMDEIIDKTELTLSAAQSMQAQQKSRAILEQIDINNVGYNTREPVPPMP